MQVLVLAVKSYSKMLVLLMLLRLSSAPNLGQAMLARPLCTSDLLPGLCQSFPASQWLRPARFETTWWLIGTDGDWRSWRVINHCSHVSWNRHLRLTMVKFISFKAPPAANGLNHPQIRLQAKKTTRAFRVSLSSSSVYSYSTWARLRFEAIESMTLLHMGMSENGVYPQL